MRVKILSPKQMLEKFLIALAEVEEGYSSQKLLNKIRQILFSLFK